MQIGDIVDDGLDNLGVIVDLGWIYPTSGKKQRAYKVRFFKDPDYNGWYDVYDLKLVTHQTAR